MQGAAHIMMTLDITINFWLTDSYLRAMKWNAWEIHLKNFMADILISLEVSEVGERYGSWFVPWLVTYSGTIGFESFFIL